MVIKTKEELLKLLEQLPEGARIGLYAVSHDGTPNYSPIEKIEYEEYIDVYVIK